MVCGYLTSYEHIQHTGNQLVILSVGRLRGRREKATEGLSVNTTKRDMCKNLVWNTGKHRRTTPTRPDISLCFQFLSLLRKTLPKLRKVNRLLQACSHLGFSDGGATVWRPTQLEERKYSPAHLKQANSDMPQASVKGICLPEHSYSLLWLMEKGQMVPWAHSSTHQPAIASKSPMQ